MARERKVIAAFGAPGMGKTAWVKQLIDGYQAANGPGSVRALDPSRSLGELGEWPGRGAPLKAWLAEVTGNGDGPAGGGWGPGLLVLDDADRWLRPWIQEEVLDLWLANRHLGLDVAITAHRPQAVSKEMIGAASELWLFAQEESHALDYFRNVGTVRRALERDESFDLPTEPGFALRIVPRRDEILMVDVFNR